LAPVGQERVLGVVTGFQEESEYRHGSQKDGADDQADHGLQLFCFKIF
jgi:hypothetical protein